MRGNFMIERRQRGGSINRQSEGRGEKRKSKENFSTSRKNIFLFTFQRLKVCVRGREFQGNSMSGESIWLSRYAGGVSLFVTDAGCIQIVQLLYSGFCTLQNISCSDRQRALSQLQKQMNWNIPRFLIRSSWVSWSNSNPCPGRSSSSSSVSL